jgi:SAM-dependent methyltransferase
VCVVDPIFEEPRLADIYDLLDDPGRPDLAPYLALAKEFQTGSVLDIGCGTGTLACWLAGCGVEVTAVDPAAASLRVARKKPFAERVHWVLGDATTVQPLQVDLVTMTGNVAQVFLADEDWAAALKASRAALRPGGRLVFEVRDPNQEAWRAWTRQHTYRVLNLPDAGSVEVWADLTELALPLVSFRQCFAFHSDGATLASDSTLVSVPVPRSPRRFLTKDSAWTRSEMLRTGRGLSSSSSPRRPADCLLWGMSWVPVSHAR